MRVYLCDSGSCQNEGVAIRMIYLRIPSGHMGSDDAKTKAEVKRFCSKNHLALWVRENYENYQDLPKKKVQ